MKRDIDEVGREEHFRVHRDSLGFEASTQVRDCLVDTVRDFERIRTVRSVDYQDHARFSSDRGRADRRRWRICYASHITQQHVPTVVMDQNRACELRSGQ